MNSADTVTSPPPHSATVREESKRGADTAPSSRSSNSLVRASDGEGGDAAAPAVPMTVCLSARLISAPAQGDSSSAAVATVTDPTLLHLQPVIPAAEFMLNGEPVLDGYRPKRNEVDQPLVAASINRISRAVV